MFGHHRRADHRPGLRIHDRSVAAEHRLAGFRREFSANHVSAGMRHAGDGAQHHDVADCFGKLKSPFRHVLGFLKIRRLQKRHLQHAGEVARLPFVDAGERPRVFAGNQDEAAAGSRSGQVQQKVRRHVHAVLLHDGHRTQSREGRGRRHFQRDFFVDRPLHVKIAPAGHRRKRFDHLGRRRTGVSGRHGHSRFQRASGDGFISQKQNSGSGR
ncbi:MAG: hypothetical protein BWX45_00414 [Deltaproteobacteria bacterium ADurb.Bin002]|nr:MAG: hypothetical protein BWX45_00414 [Deltaproteobacteria bacterium ADurb.Bin002]